jgi:hypothetical protein
LRQHIETSPQFLSEEWTVFLCSRPGLEALEEVIRRAKGGED